MVALNTPVCEFGLPAIDFPLPNSWHELFDAMSGIAASACAPAEQVTSTGCSIRWRPA